MRVDEITLHHRDNAMLVATHGRSIWILDHLEPIQEYAAAQAADAKLFTPPPFSMYRRPANDRNYEFWGDQTFFGENPPQAAVVSWFLKKPANEVKLKITDAAGKDVREISGPGARQQQQGWHAGGVLGSARAAAAGAGRGGGRRARRRGRCRRRRSAAGGGAGGGFGGAAAQSPFGAGCGGGGRGGGGGFGGGAVTAGPFVLAGTYNVALVVDGKTVETKPLKVMTDPQVALSDVEREADVRHGDGDARVPAHRHRVLDARFGRCRRARRNWSRRPPRRRTCRPT